MDLFDAAADRAREANAPLPARLRPRTLAEMAGQAHLLGPGRPLRTLIESDALRSVILWGPPGSGKTTLARITAELTARDFVTLSAVSAGVKDVRAVIEAARRRLGEQGRGTILFLDEIHRFNKAQQDALLPAVEDGTLVLIGATTENPYFEINSPLLSRASLFRLEPLSDDEVAAVLDRALREPRGLGGEFEVEADAHAHLVGVANGDARRVLVCLELAARLAQSAGRSRIVRADAVAAAGARHVAHDRAGDAHYDVISAFIKSLRGSDVNAALHWLARMLEGGEDPRFVARRMVIFASEDVGLADSDALGVAVHAAQAVDLVGLPEARLNLAHAVIYLARAVKSNSVIAAIDAAEADLQERRFGPVPAHLRGSGYPGARRLGHGEGYEYPHDFAGHWVEQEYLPVGMEERPYYVPSGQGDDVPVEPGTGRPTGSEGEG
ncbi:MAG: replication-associated recombination protein A [Acidimicrobiia bacterium]|nr:replication-associated recombination protein A [Acidimicrobiia bacterium]